MKGSEERSSTADVNRRVKEERGGEKKRERERGGMAWAREIVRQYVDGRY